MKQAREPGAASGGGLRGSKPRPPPSHIKTDNRKINGRTIFILVGFSPKLPAQLQHNILSIMFGGFNASKLKPRKSIRDRCFRFPPVGGTTQLYSPDCECRGDTEILTLLLSPLSME